MPRHSHREPLPAHPSSPTRQPTAHAHSPPPCPKTTTLPASTPSALLPCARNGRAVRFEEFRLVAIPAYLRPAPLLSDSICLGHRSRNPLGPSPQPVLPGSSERPFLRFRAIDRARLMIQPLSVASLVSPLQYLPRLPVHGELSYPSRSVPALPNLYHLHCQSSSNLESRHLCQHLYTTRALPLQPVLIVYLLASNSWTAHNSFGSQQVPSALIPTS
jgi:hypothetical protein